MTDPKDPKQKRPYNQGLAVAARPHPDVDMKVKIPARFYLWLGDYLKTKANPDGTPMTRSDYVRIALGEYLDRNGVDRRGV